MNKLILVIIVQIVAILTGIILVFVGEKKCKTKKCKDLDFLMKSYINEEITPCNDFYSFACSKMPESESANKGLVAKTLGMLSEDLVKYLENVKAGGKPEAFYKANQIYKQCLNQDSVPDPKVAMSDLIKSAGGFPAAEGAEWDKTQDKFVLVDAMKKLRQEGLSPGAYFSLTFKRSPFDSSLYIMSVSKPIPYTVFKPQFLAMCDDECVKAVTSVYTKILTLAGTKPDVVAKEANEFLAQDKEIAALTYNLSPPSPDLYKERTMSVEVFASKYAFFDWKSYFKFMIQFDSPTETLPKDQLILDEYPEYLSGIQSIFSNQTKRQQANYIVWYNLMKFMYLLDFQRDPNYCVNIFMAQTMPEMLTALSVQIRDESHYGAAKSMIKSIGDELLRQLSAWMDEDTRQKAVNKLNHLTITTGYFDVFKDAALIDEYYKDLSVGDDFYHSHRAILKNQKTQENYCFVKSFGEKLCQLIVYGELNLISPNIFYDPGSNGIVVADSILREPLFSKKWPKYMIYSRLGFLIGHELIHVLDSRGSQYDETGNINKWWGGETAKSFQAKAKCFENQYSEFKFYNGSERVPLPPLKSLAENVADNGGFSISFKTYQDNKGWLPDLKLPTLDYTPNQLYFIGLAHLFCDANELSEVPLQFYDVHAPGPIRVEEILQNSEEFSKAFSCEEGSEMNPSSRCLLF